MNNCVYIDTRPGARSVFAPASPADDYDTWLRARYEATQTAGEHRTYCHGLAQHVHAIVQSPAELRGDVMAFGPYAGTVAAFIEKISGGAVVVEVLG